MSMKKETVAMLLAGGQGSRLMALTEKTAKPAVEFGGKYRIIDFPLSNCINSGIDTVGVLTQYQPLVLNEYIGNGEPWDLDRYNGGVHVLPPYQGKNGADWYKGTANAIYQNLTFINRYDPEYVVILSGDHIYKMDYSKMIEYHREKGSECTIAVIDVPIEEASRFGIMYAADDGKIFEFAEKPAHPKSTTASMGIYVFNRATLEKYLVADEADPASTNDFGHDVIPAMLASGVAMYAYKFSGYWKDVGTLTSLWDANMDLLGADPAFNLNDRSWKIFSRPGGFAPQYTGAEAEIYNSIVSEGCEVYGKVENSVLFCDVYVAPGAVVRDSVVMTGAQINEGAKVDYSLIDCAVSVGKNAKIGDAREQGKITLIGQRDIPEGEIVAGGAIVDSAYVFEGGKE